MGGSQQGRRRKFVDILKTMKLKKISDVEYVHVKTGVSIMLAEPPVFKRAHEVFDLTEKKPIFAYGGKIWNPYNGGMDDAIVAHEMVHLEQQGEDSDGWWEKYFTDPAFRLEQEIPAYKVQYREMKKTISNYSVLALHKARMCKDLSGPMYGNAIGYAAAFRAIGQ